MNDTANAEERSRLESASNIIDNARYFIERTESPDLLQQAKHARVGWQCFAEELSAQLLAEGHDWPVIVVALGIDSDDEYGHSRAERRAGKLRERRAGGVS